jgi:hypothetical protein
LNLKIRGGGGKIYHRPYSLGFKGALMSLLE